MRKPALKSANRAKVWRTLLVLGINEGLRRGAFTLCPEDTSWWPSKDERWIKFSFEHDGIPAVAGVHDAGHGELSVKTALWPTAFGEMQIHCANVPMKKMGEAYAWGYLARTGGACLEAEAKPSAHCSTPVRERVMALRVTPLGYRDRRTGIR